MTPSAAPGVPRAPGEYPAAMSQPEGTGNDEAGRLVPLVVQVECK
jgi:hypothetical protein